VKHRRLHRPAGALCPGDHALAYELTGVVTVEVVELTDERPPSPVWRCGECGSAECAAQRYVTFEVDDPDRWESIHTAHELVPLQ
jgi:hypothetical protein